jgi:NTE family protein
MKNKKKTAFVFAGGGSLGAVQVGMLKAVASQGIKADFLVGASVGAINAAFFASDPSYQGVVKLEKIWTSIKQQDVFPVSPLAGALSFLSWRNHICSVKPLKQLIKKHIIIANLEDTRLPCYIVATDLFNGIEVSFSKGAVIDALLASSAVPGVFPPVKLKKHYLKGAKRIVVFPTGMSCGLQTPPNGVVEMALQTLNIAVSNRLKFDIEKYSDAADIVLLPVLCPLDVSIFNFSRTEELIDRSEKNVREWFQNCDMDDACNPELLTPHYH